MEDSERLAIAAHLHVVLRRKTGRVTDTEWMAGNQLYAQAMADFALAHAHENADEELARLAQRLQSSWSSPGTLRRGGTSSPAAAPAMASASAPALAEEPQILQRSAPRYVGGLR